MLNFPIRLSHRMAALRRSIESGDAKPTDGALVVFKELATDRGRHLTALGALMAADLEGFNRQLAGRKLEPVT